LEDRYGEEDGLLIEPPSGRLLDVNFRGVVNVVKLARWVMRGKGKTGEEDEEEGGRGKDGGSIVITTSATGYAPEQGLPVYSAVKAGVCISSAPLAACS